MADKTKKELIEFLQRSDVEIICVDWEDESDEGWPPSVAIQYEIIV